MESFIRIKGKRERVKERKSAAEGGSFRIGLAKGVPGDYSFITRQRGMFSFCGLTPQQVEALKQKYSIYIVGSGRINVAGITEQNVEPLCNAIADVVKD